MSNNKKQFLQKKVTIGDVEYTFQKLPTKKALEIKQKWLDQNNNIIELTMCELLLELLPLQYLSILYKQLFSFYLSLLLLKELLVKE